MFSSAPDNTKVLASCLSILVLLSVTLLIGVAHRFVPFLSGVYINVFDVVFMSLCVCLCEANLNIFSDRLVLLYSRVLFILIYLTIP